MVSGPRQMHSLFAELVVVPTRHRSSAAALWYAFHQINDRELSSVVAITATRSLREEIRSPKQPIID